ncbi:MAG: hypothetical protein NC548_18885 [Lachnospiraceae bacterium]|nr:hypothetical protein [Lachnospiraceae bacterium]
MEKKYGLRGFEPEDDRSILTIDLNREELGILLDGIKNHRIKQTRLRLNALHQRKLIQKRRSRTTVERLPVLWRKFKKVIRKQIDGWQQELPLF